LCIKGDLSDNELDELSNALALLIGRLRLRPTEYEQWLQYWRNSKPIPLEWKKRFRDRFWRSFVSDEATDEVGGEVQFDEIALQGYLGEVILYLIQTKYYAHRIGVVPKKPKGYSKDSGIDCLELCGIVAEPSSFHYIVWESKGLSLGTLGSYPNKIYNQHLYQTPKSFAEMVDQLADIYGSDDVIADFVDEMIDDFYSRPPSRRKCFGGCVSYSGRGYARSDAFSTFWMRFKDDLAEDPRCCQVRLCAVGDFRGIACQVRDKIWTKLLP
jgi:hypothetical protein